MGQGHAGQGTIRTGICLGDSTPTSSTSYSLAVLMSLMVSPGFSSPSTTLKYTMTPCNGYICLSPHISDAHYQARKRAGFPCTPDLWLPPAHLWHVTPSNIKHCSWVRQGGNGR